MLVKCSTQYVSKFGKLTSGHRTGKRSVFIPIPKKGNAKECSNYNTIGLISIGLISHASTEKAMAPHSSTLAWKIPWTEVCDIVQETGIKTIPMEKKHKKAKWLSGEDLKIAVKKKRREKPRRKGKI